MPLEGYFFDGSGCLFGLKGSFKGSFKRRPLGPLRVRFGSLGPSRVP